MTKTAPPSAAAFGNIYAGRKVLVTGHTGFKGAWLCEWLLALGAEVSGLAIDCEDPSLFRELKLAARLTDRRGDVRDLPLVTETIKDLAPDLVFHLAAQPLVRLSYIDPVGTFTTNVTGSINVMEAVRLAPQRCAVVMVTTDKVYENREINYAYRETDPLGGHDPYSASKAAAEIAIQSYGKSFFSQPNSRVALASARAGNVIGGGDWALDRLVPDCIRALRRGEKIAVRNRNATRPWQHVLDPLSGYLTLGAALWRSFGDKTGQAKNIRSAFNFGPHSDSNRTVGDLANEVTKNWAGTWFDQTENEAPHEAGLLNLNIEKASQVLAWRPVWGFGDAVKRTISWYREFEQADPAELTRRQIAEFHADAVQSGLDWAKP